MKNEGNNLRRNDSIRCTSVRFDGISQTDRDFLRKHRETILKETDFNKFIEKVNAVQQELSSLDSFSSVIPVVNTKNENSEVDVTFKVRKSRIKYSVGSTINKKGKVGFEISAFIPNLFGTLSSIRLGLETFGKKSREFSFGLFTPMLLNSNLNMSYSLFNNTLNDNNTPFSNNYFGSKLRLSDKFGANNLTLESSMRETHANLDNGESTCEKHFKETPMKTLKNSISYSWNKNSHSSNEIKNDTKSNTIRQFNIEYAGFNSDVQFIKIEAFQQWKTMFRRCIEKPAFFNNLHLGLNLGLGMLLPNFSKGNFGLKTTIHDRFFLGGNNGFHRCLIGFASGSVGPCLKGDVDASTTTNSRPKNTYIGGNGYLSGELTLQYPLNMNKYGFNIEPNLMSYINVATIVDGHDTILTGNGSFSDKKEILDNFKRTIRASTGIGKLTRLKECNLE
ncbi:hypothetical protein RS030_4633 [Cryptosporidium xiaoi]|uniref:Bacterial surface antigen (D15) domain-containing protein n=1 Tax=Cryptosporidium xiaoi TaxID=659607 RepID=A0AAV9XWB2_9CRYT